jgi:hypothetical protein
MINIEVNPTLGLQKLLNTNIGSKVEKTLADAQYDIAQKIAVKVKEDGFAPRKTGKFASSHRAVKGTDESYVISSLRASNGTPLWKYIVGGHRVLTTERSRRWWFWHLKHELGGHYNRKTNGPPGYVPPNNYSQRAINTINNNSVKVKITNKII